MPIAGRSRGGNKDIKIPLCLTSQVATCASYRSANNPAAKKFVADPKAAAAASTRTRSARFRRVGLAARAHHAGLFERGRDLLHAVDQIDRRRRRQHETAGRITPAADRRIRLDVVEPGDAEFDAQRLAVENQAGDRVGKSLFHIGAVEVADLRRLALASTGWYGGFRSRFGTHLLDLLRRGLFARRAAFRRGATFRCLPWPRAFGPRAFDHMSQS